MAGICCSAEDLWITAATVWGEARGESRAGQYAVAWVIRNRQALHPRWQGKSLAAICRARAQFSPWGNAPTRALLEEVSLDTPSFVACLQATVAVLGDLVPCNVGASTHFYAPAGVKTPPRWAQGKTPYATIGGHRFYEGIA